MFQIYKRLKLLKHISVLSVLMYFFFLSQKHWKITEHFEIRQAQLPQYSITILVLKHPVSAQLEKLTAKFDKTNDKKGKNICKLLKLLKY